MQRDKQQSRKQFAMPTLRVIYAAEGKTLRTLLVWRELMREEPDHERLARIWRTSLGQSEVLRGETAAVASPGGRGASEPRIHSGADLTLQI